MRLYKKMKKRLAKKRLGNYNWKLYQIFGLPEKGKVYNDCDRFNHILKNIKIHRNYYTKGSTIWSLDCIKEDESYFCGCLHITLCPAWSKDEIIKYHSFNCSKEYIDEQKKLGWWTEIEDKLMEYVKSGGLICDDQGLPSDGWKKITGRLINYKGFSQESFVQ